jgi:hypothetical protein
MDMEMSTHLPDQHDQLPAAGNAAWRSAASLITAGFPSPGFCGWSLRRRQQRIEFAETVGP